jgi:hypothetical protein
VVWVKVHRLLFDVGGEAPTGYRVRLPDDLFDWPPVALDGIPLRVVSPLALYQIRISLGRQGSFGGLSDKQRRSAALLRERFFAGRDEAELEPDIEPLAS